MSKIVWDADTERLYETGVRNGVLYPKDQSGKYSLGVAWNGLTAVTETPSGAEETAVYADDIKYLSLYSIEELGGTIEAYTYPDEFAVCDGSEQPVDGVFIGQQARKPFGLCYRTVLGNDAEGESYGHKLHLIYGAIASPTERAYQTINDSPEAITFSWEFKTTPVSVTGHKATACLTIDSTKVDPDDLAALEAVLYGAEEFSAEKTYAVGTIVSYGTGTAAKTYRCKTAVSTPGSWDQSKWDVLSDVVGPQLPLPDEVIAMFEA